MINFQHPIIQHDLEELYETSINWEPLQNKTVLITGATGMLASYLSFMFLFLNEKYNYNIRLFLLARNKQKLKQLFGQPDHAINFLIQDVCSPIELHAEVDYIFHAAGAASPYQINNDPTGIIKANTIGTLNVLELARSKNTQKILFTSTREVYGKVTNTNKINENEMGVLDPLDERSCYPESKRIAESLLKSYSLQYGISFNSLRIAHTYGPGMRTHNDGRVMADFFNSILNKQPIQLHASGTAERAFCYLTDTLQAVFRILLQGQDNHAYNIANESEPIRIADLARLLQKVSGNHQPVLIPPQDQTPKGYCNYERTQLDTRKVEELGWKPAISLNEGIRRTLKSFCR
ncbi:nucleoside-diphosphate-sugar epimerase [Mangrovibacterium marinum]|uniref:Nucleoside-diphosphate-sugar epimerase n=1 Tax=Mangrovibacterium marinum TaxID=1639118 RepID=A0A2T5C6E2_9BACT|nr:NAD-dependent epimerase/dehydratase family protein [Mangrovibacterium marinum]PTN10486.1 nucleoside-diphosphate-sugar epimerase [Mangrovibacterium marinum]